MSNYLIYLLCPLFDHACWNYFVCIGSTLGYTPQVVLQCMHIQQGNPIYAHLMWISHIFIELQTVHFIQTMTNGLTFDMHA